MNGCYKRRLSAAGLKKGTVTGKFTIMDSNIHPASELV